MIVTPAKLQDDSWGIRIKLDAQGEEPPQIGEVVTVRAKSGKEWPTQIAAFVSSGTDWWICRTCAPPRGATKPRVPKEQTSLKVGRAEPKRMDFDPDENYDYTPADGERFEWYEDEKDLPF